MPVKYPCGICQKNVNNFKAICCDSFDSWVHFKCSNLTNEDYDHLDQSPDLWFCSTCFSEGLPFSPDTNGEEILSKSSYTELFTQLNQHLEDIQENEDEVNDPFIPCNCSYMDITELNKKNFRNK